MCAGDDEGEVLPDRQDRRLSIAIAEGKAAGLLPDAKQLSGAQLAVTCFAPHSLGPPFPLPLFPFSCFPFFPSRLRLPHSVCPLLKSLCPCPSIAAPLSSLPFKACPFPYWHLVSVTRMAPTHRTFSYKAHWLLQGMHPKISCMSCRAWRTQRATALTAVATERSASHCA